MGTYMNYPYILQIQEKVKYKIASLYHLKGFKANLLRSRKFQKYRGNQPLLGKKVGVK